MATKKNSGILTLAAFFLSSGISFSRADDMRDGISEYLDEPIAAETNLGDKETNLKFIIADAVGQAKKTGGGKKSKINFNDGKGESNQNSVVVGAGSRVDKIINVVVEK